MKRRLTAAAVAALVCPAILRTAAAQAESDVAALAKGEELLVKNCARCHAIGTGGSSTHGQAPPFRQVVTRYPLDHLAEAMAEGLSTGHPDMPEFVFASSEIDAILAFLGDLKAKTNGDAPKPEEAK